MSVGITRRGFARLAALAAGTQAEAQGVLTASQVVRRIQESWHPKVWSGDLHSLTASTLGIPRLR